MEVCRINLSFLWVPSLFVYLQLKPPWFRFVAIPIRSCLCWVRTKVWSLSLWHLIKLQPNWKRELISANWQRCGVDTLLEEPERKLIHTVVHWAPCYAPAAVQLLRMARWLWRDPTSLTWRSPYSKHGSISEESQTTNLESRNLRIAFVHFLESWSY